MTTAQWFFQELKKYNAGLYFFQRLDCEKKVSNFYDILNLKWQIKKDESLIDLKVALTSMATYDFYVW